MRLKVDAGGLQIDRLSVADGAAWHFGERPNRHRAIAAGSIDINLDARDDAGDVLLARFAPKAAAMLGRGAATMAPAKLHAQLTVDGDAPKALAESASTAILAKCAWRSTAKYRRSGGVERRRSDGVRQTVRR